MCRSIFIYTLVMLGAGALALDAAPVDPQGVFDTQIAGIPVTPVDPFSFNANQSGGGVFSFQNISGNDWVGVDWFVTLPDDESFTLSGGPFYGSFGVSSKDIGNGLAIYDISFGQPINGGIPNGTIFSINMNDPSSGTYQNGAGSWGAGTLISVVETDAAPEPASLWLLGGGIALLASVRRLRSRAQHKP